MTAIYTKNEDGNLVKSEPVSTVLKLKELRKRKQNLMDQRSRINERIDALNILIDKAIELQAAE